MPGGNGPAPHSWFEKQCSQPSQSQTCIENPADALTNKPDFKTTVVKAGAAADAETDKIRHLAGFLLELGLGVGGWGSSKNRGTRHNVVPFVEKKETTRNGTELPASLPV